MKYIYLVRHAKSSWKDKLLSDRQRPLNKRGKENAPVMAERLRARGGQPEQLRGCDGRRRVTPCAEGAPTGWGRGSSRPGWQLRAHRATRRQRVARPGAHRRGRWRHHAVGNPCAARRAGVVGGAGAAMALRRPDRIAWSEIGTVYGGVNHELVASYFWGGR